MNPLNESLAGRIAVDRDGCLYDRRLRSLVGQLPPSTRISFEALAALRMASHAMHLHMQRWADSHGLSEGRLQVLFRLRHAPGHALAMAGLAEALNVSPRNITGLVDHLEKDGLVERVPDPTDRRSVLARLTEPGARKIESIWREGIERELPLVEGFTREELVQLRHVCLRLFQRMCEIGRNQ